MTARIDSQRLSHLQTGIMSEFFPFSVHGFEYSDNDTAVKACTPKQGLHQATSGFYHADLRRVKPRAQPQPSRGLGHAPLGPDGQH